MDIRRATREDAVAASAIFEERGVPVLHSGIPASSVLACLEEGRVVGATALEVAARSGLSVWLAVAEDCGGRGIGRSLLRALLSRAQELGLRQLYVVVPRVSDLFTGAGFRGVGEGDVAREVRAMRGYPEELSGSGHSVLRVQLETLV